jgi:diguanylate cyclase (GGDEF)-like protein
VTTNPDPGGSAADSAARELARVRSEIEASWAELAALHQQLAAARNEVGSSKAGQLVEANEHLVLAALAAQRSVESGEQTIRDMAEAARHDPLTGLPDSALLRARLAMAISDAKRGGRHVALLLLNLTDFKLINDTLGHATGDQVLQLAARSLAAAVRPIDTVSRHRGNDFLILLPQLDQVSDAVEHAATIVAALGAPTMLNNHVLRLTANVGISIHPADGADADSLIDRAVAAMYRAKWRGLGSYAFQGETGTSERSLELRTLESLRQPLVDHQSAVAEAERRNALLQEANTQLLLAAVSAQELKEAAEQAQRRQTDFLAVLAHELRNPLTPLRNAAAILGRIPTEGPMLSKVQGIIERQVQNMSRLVEDLLDVSRVSAGKLRLEKESVDLNRLIEDVVQACRPAMDSRLQLFEVKLVDQPLQIDGDPGRLTQILSNLLDNASKYTPDHGEIRLSAVLVDDSVVLTVSDTGIGITAESLPTIFDPFMQEPHATLFNGSGLGIGLTVVRELVEGHGGHVAAFSQGKGAGSRFVVTLPVVRAASNGR